MRQKKRWWHELPYTEMAKSGTIVLASKVCKNLSLNIQYWTLKSCIHPALRKKWVNYRQRLQGERRRCFEKENSQNNIEIPDPLRHLPLPLRPPPPSQETRYAANRQLVGLWVAYMQVCIYVVLRPVAPFIGIALLPSARQHTLLPCPCIVQQCCGINLESPIVDFF